VAFHLLAAPGAFFKRAWELSLVESTDMGKPPTHGLPHHRFYLHFLAVSYKKAQYFFGEVEKKNLK